MIDRLLLEPSPEAWLDQLDTVRPCPEWLEAARTRTRSALGLDSGRRVAATGHQAEIWHAGILAKDLAVAALPAARVHYVADHDANRICGKWWRRARNAVFLSIFGPQL